MSDFQGKAMIGLGSDKKSVVSFRSDTSFSFFLFLHFYVRIFKIREKMYLLAVTTIGGVLCDGFFVFLLPGDLSSHSLHN